MRYIVQVYDWMENPTPVTFSKTFKNRSDAVKSYYWISGNIKDDGGWADVMLCDSEDNIIMHSVNGQCQIQADIKDLVI